MAEKERSVADDVIPEAVKEERTRVPMSVPRQKLTVPKIPGFRCYWMLDRPGRLLQAGQAGYEFVDTSEISVQNLGLADDISLDGNNDLGSRVSQFGGIGAAGQPEMLYLMKIKQEWANEDQAELQAKNDAIINQIGTSKATEGTPGDTSNRYLKTGGRENMNT